MHSTACEPAPVVASMLRSMQQLHVMAPAKPATDQVRTGVLMLMQATRTHAVRTAHRLPPIALRFRGNAADRQ